MKTLINLTKTSTVIAAAVFLMTVGTATSANALYFTDAPYLQYGDFQSYALGLLNYVATGDEKGTHLIDYSIPSSPGAIKNGIILYTDPGGTDLKNNGSADINDPFDSVGGKSGGSYFSTSLGGFPDPGTLGGGVGSADVPGGTELTWDASIAALNSYLNGDSLVFYFNNNQTGKSLESISLWAFGQVAVVDTDGVAPTKYFDFTNSAYLSSSYLGGVPNGDVTNYMNTTGSAISGPGAVGQPDSFLPGAPQGTLPPLEPGDLANYQQYVFVRGELCFVDANTPVDCSLPHEFKINTNLGANEASFSLFSPELQALLDSPGAYDLIRADFRLATLNNGYEQLFILATPGGGPPPVIPEPSTIVLLLTGVCGLFVYQRLRRNP